MKMMFLLAALVSIGLSAETDSLHVVPVDKEQLHQLVSNRNGKDLFLNIWATWCRPCMEEFPDIIKLAKKYKTEKKNVEFILVSADYPDEIESQIIPFLKKFPSIPFRVYVADFNSQGEFISSLSKNWSGAIPATFLYTAEGKQKKMLLGQHSYGQFKKEIDLLLHSE